MQFTLTATFETTPETLFRLWLSSEGHSKMTGAEAEASDKVGASFTAWDGYISGRNVAIEPYTRIVQSWRAAEFEDEHEDSEVEILFEPKNGKTQLTLIHRNLPDTFGEQYKKGWEDYYFTPIAKFLSEI
jgi:activator of HSP90 ATPase